MAEETSTERPVWQHDERTAKLTFAVPYVGELSLTVHAALPGAGWQTPEEQKELAVRHAILLLRNLANALERHRP